MHDLARWLSIDTDLGLADDRGLVADVAWGARLELNGSFGIAGAYLVGVELLGLDSGSYLSSLENAVDFHDSVAQSLVKSVVFGVLVGWIATWRGFNCEPNAAGVSRATTSTVVTASFWILLSDYAITAMWGV